MSNLPEKGTKEYAMADALSRPFGINGLYEKLKLPLNYEDLNKKDPIYITHVADLADSKIREAINSGKDLDDPKVQDEIRAAFYGGAAGASSAIKYNKLLRFLRLRR
jgi:hypothetical protein